MVVNVAAFGWHATIFLGWGLLFACLIVTAGAVVFVRYLSSAA
jgi:hypothetical protein